MEAILWLVLMVICLIIEGMTVMTVSLWFAAGALVALLVSLIGLQVWVQVTLFFVVSGVLLACLRPMVQRHFTPKLSRTNVDAIIGTKGYVTADIDNLSASGKVKLGGMEWSARSSMGLPIPAGTLVKVDHIEGVKAYVSPVEKKEKILSGAAAE